MPPRPLGICCNRNRFKYTDGTTGGLFHFNRHPPDSFQVFGELAQYDSVPDLTHDVKVPPEIVPGREDCEQDFPRLKQMTQVGPAE